MFLKGVWRCLRIDVDGLGHATLLFCASGCSFVVGAERKEEAVMKKKIETWMEVKEYCFDRLEEIRRINDGHPCPSAFVCIAAFMGFLSRLAYGTNSAKDHKDGQWFKDFVTNFMPQKYSPQADLMYSTFRCGIVHAMSFDLEIPRAYAGTRSDYLESIGGVNRPAAKLAITHDARFISLCGGGELLQYEKDGKKGPYVLVASVLCDDIAMAIDKMFGENEIQENSTWFIQVQRLITGELVSDGATSPSCNSDSVSLSGSGIDYTGQKGTQNIATTTMLSGSGENAN